MKKLFTIIESERERILGLHNDFRKKQYSDVISEQASPLNQPLSTGQWLTYPNDNNYSYQKRGDKWITKNNKTNKEYDLSSNPKYKVTVDKLEKQFPGGKSSSTSTGNTTQNNATQGNTTQNNVTQNNATQGNTTQNNATQGNYAMFNPEQL
jgi:hypothetical protein